VTGNPIWYYEVEIKSFTQQVYPNLRPATLVGYDGISPGPTFVVPRGTETIVRFINNATKKNSVHLHGSPSRAPFDGWAEDTTNPGQYKDYYYPNNQNARMLWYHDHAIAIVCIVYRLWRFNPNTLCLTNYGQTAENAYMGQAGAYLITDPAEDSLNLPSGYGTFDIPLVLSSKYYNSDGSLRSLEGEDDSLWGDVIHVNGQPWPFFNVQPRKYRFRFLNAAISRTFALYFARSTATGTKLPFKVIASDAGLLTGPQQVNQMYISMAERYEIVFDFSSYAGQTILLNNIVDANDLSTDEEYAATDKVMKFVVSSTPVSDPSTVPASLRSVPFPPSSSGIDHHFRFHRSNSEWLINDVGFADVNNRILANVPRGKVEIWELENSSGGWTHPIHVHLVDFRVISRINGEGRGVMSYESAGLKDVVWLARGETVRVEAHYAPWDGVYMFHCHNLIHEDHDMMAAFNVTKLEGFGYSEETDFGDPMDERWRAKPYQRSDFNARTGPFSDAAITAKVNELAEEQPYSELAEVEEALDDYWAAQGQRKKRDVKTAGPIPRYRRFVV
jgi:FtsP/CotA-like multicopper oxidase with cupredoxin domain